jgi:predicted Rdx family selenoprotein
MSMPDLSPLIAHNLVCRDCGSVLKPKAIMARRGQKDFVDHLEYRCVNAKTGCSYKIESNSMAPWEMKPLRLDGSEAKI